MPLVRIDKRIDVLSKKISFKTAIKKNTKVKERVELKEIDLNVIGKKVLGSIPIQVKVTDVDKQRAESRTASVLRGTIPSVVAPVIKSAMERDAMKLKVEDWNALLYRRISGVYINSGLNKHGTDKLPMSVISSKMNVVFSNSGRSFATVSFSIESAFVPFDFGFLIFDFNGCVWSEKLFLSESRKQ